MQHIHKSLLNTKIVLEINFYSLFKMSLDKKISNSSKSINSFQRSNCKKQSNNNKQNPSHYPCQFFKRAISLIAYDPFRSNIQTHSS